MKQGRREARLRRTVTASGVIVTLAVAGFATWFALRPQTSSVTPIASASPTVTQAPPTCAGVEDPALFVSRFMAQRGSPGADTCMTAMALDRFEGRAQITWYEIGTPEQVDANSFQVVVEVMYGEQGGTETLFVGPGTPATSSSGLPIPLVVRGVEFG